MPPPPGSPSAARTTRERLEKLLLGSSGRPRNHEHLWTFCLRLQVMEFYCESCETAMCLDCTEGEHGEHETVPLPDVVEQHKAALKTQLDAIRSR